MQIVIPMAGMGSRFVQAGYKTLKPLIEVDGMPLIEHVLRMFPGEHDFLFICARPHLTDTPLLSVLQQLEPKATIIPIEPHKDGPLCTVLAAVDYLKPDEPIILNYCDAAVLWDYAHFKHHMETLHCAGCLVAFKGFHPHSLGSTLYAYIREQNNYLLEIREKQAFTTDRMNEFASTGTYYFRRGDILTYYFQKAIQRTLKVNDEYYASLPYNLLLEDNLDVYIYQVEQFLHWGVPQDLEEYSRWSDYFAHYADWKPTAAPLAGMNLIPMAGAGSRFSREGYVQPKPLIPVSGVPMVRRALDTFPPTQASIAACQAEYISTLEPHLQANGHRVELLPVEGLTQGQAATCLLARDYIDPLAPLLVTPCDAAVVYDQEKYAALTTNPHIDCLLWTFRNHAHANRYPEQYGWVRLGFDDAVQAISCKIPLSEDVRHDPGLIGAFWFRQADMFFDGVERLIAHDRRINGEFYVDSVIEMLLEHKQRVKIFDVEHYICLGTPNDVRSFEFWATYFHQMPHHPYRNGAKL